VDIQLEAGQAHAQQTLGFQVAFNILFGMAFLASSFVLLIVNERKNKVCWRL
jgi:hypothetical protein